MCLGCPSDKRTARAKEGFCVYCHPLQPMSEEFIHDKTGMPVTKHDPQAYRIYRCPKCRAMWAPSAFAARPPKEG
jgi:uncharacterized protein with PIN domain